MAPRYRDLDDFDIPETHGGEARPRPLKSRRLVDVMETSSKGKGREKRESAASVCRERTSHLPSATEPRSPRQAETDFTTPKATVPERSVSKRSPSVKTGSPKTAAKAPDKPSAPDLPPDTRAVLSVTPAGEGETVTVVLALPDPEGKKAQRISFHLLVEQYAELGVKTGEITPEYADTLLDAGTLCGAIRRGISLLGYGDQSARRLAYKLTAKGVEVLWDDRSVSAGFMFSDADLFGVPVRIVVSPKGLKNGTIEISSRDKSMQEKKPVDEAVDFVYNYVVDELAKLDCRL